MLPLATGIEGNKKLHLAASEQGYGNAILVEEAVSGEGRQSRARCEYAYEIKGIGTRERTRLARWRLPPDVAQFARCLGQSELLARKSRDKAAATNFSPGLEPAIDVQQVPPSGEPTRRWLTEW